ncbi:acyltransferase family protein [Microbulbifer harenosus]|uniref:Acyltransferase n=1 Tax=Microbulbifer harenosus TaxID=2576840 RepID=A0ABY2UII6_9GAMM|nr:acyltransferase [Microbulbifer harenosus]TLM76966.1 acyltransferase [Microbulbifer harenosus]
MISTGLSVYLHYLRFTAALIVLLSHFGYPRFSEGRWAWVRDFNLGSDAVIVFFVLSGLLIAHAADRTSGSLKQFSFDRITRLISVALPALILGFALDRLGAYISPEGYDFWYYNPLSLPETLLRGLTFSNEWTGMVTRMGTNGPYWSLSYEAAYYALFAVSLYLRGTRRVLLLTAGTLIFGPNVLLLMPTWLMGVALYAFIKNGNTIGRNASLGLSIGTAVIYLAALAASLPATLREYTDPLHPYFDLRFSDEPLWNNFLGLLVTLHLMGVAGLTRNYQPTKLSRSVSAWLSGGSFSLYLVHFPVMQLLCVLFLPQYSSWTSDAILLLITIATCYLFAGAFERPLERWRTICRSLFTHHWQWKLDR